MKHAISLVAASLALSLSAVAPAPAEQINVLSHRVHQLVSVGGTPGTSGGDVTADWRAKNGDINWITGDVDAIHDRLRRELQLQTGTISVGVMLSRFAYPEVYAGLEPLDAYQAADPIDDFKGISEGMLQGMTYQGHIYGIPFRQATSALLYNEALLKEAGFDGPPKTFDEMLSMAKALHHVDKNGSEVFGIADNVGQDPVHTLNFIMAFGKQLIEPDFTLNAGSDQVVKALAALKDLYDHGGVSRSVLTATLDDDIAAVQSGRAAMTIDVPGRLGVLNDPKLSQFPGSIKVVPVPPGADGVSPAQTEVWYLVIPKNAPDKQKAWSLVKALSQPEATVREALNGNGAVRPAAFEDKRVADFVPTAAAQLASVAVAKIAMPGFRNAPQAGEVIQEEVGAVLLGRSTPEQGAANLARRLAPLLPAKQ
jgi:multiple sugar transport system substrate-binding protein